MIKVFIKEEDLEFFASFSASTDGSEANEDKKDICIEFIEMPLTAEIIYNGKTAEVAMFIRDEICSHMKMFGHGTFQDGKLSVDVGEEEIINIAFSVGENINIILNQKGLLTTYADMDADTQGLLMWLDENSDIKVKLVEGANRPNLLCDTIFAGQIFTRPYMDGLIESVDDKSFEEVKKEAEDGELHAMEKLGQMYLNGDSETEQDPEKAYEFFVKCAEEGNSNSLFNLGLMTAKGFGTKRDFVKAAEWMRNAANEGDPHASTMAKQFEEYAHDEEMAKAGDAKAQARFARDMVGIAKSLDQADKVKDYEESVMWAKKAAEKDIPEAYFVLGTAFANGQGVTENIKKAIEFYQKGADLEDAECQYKLGYEYMQGNNIKRDAHKGFELIKKSAESGYGLAMYALGKCYQFAWETNGNMRTAIKWYEKTLEVMDYPGLERKIANFKDLENVMDFDEEYEEDEALTGIQSL